MSGFGPDALNREATRVRMLWVAGAALGTPCRETRRGRPMSAEEFTPFTHEELGMEGVTALPAKEVMSILDLAADIDLAIDGAAPIDLAVALNANIMAPIEAAVSANLLSDDSTSQGMAHQGVTLNQTLDPDAIATGLQHSSIDQSDTTTGGTDTATADGSGGGEQPTLLAATDSPHAAHTADVAPHALADTAPSG